MKDIVSLIREYGIILTQTGNILLGYCPLHNDSNRPNFTVYPATNSWFCYGCSVGGGPTEFVAAIEGISRAEAITKLTRGSTSLEELQDRLENLDTSEEIASFNLECDVLVSRHLGNYLVQHKDQLANVMGFLQGFDHTLTEGPVSMETFQKIFSNTQRLFPLNV